MRPKSFVRSDYGAPAQSLWISPSRRGPRTSIGPKILLAAVMVVAGVIGISGIYPQLIGTEQVPDAGSPLPVMSLSNPDARTRGLGTVATTASAFRRVVTTGQGGISRPTPTFDATQPQQPEAVAPAEPLAVADVPEAQTAAPAAEKPKSTKVAVKLKPVVKKKVVRVAHHRSFHGAYAQSNGWGWFGGGWGGQGGGYRF